MSLAGFDRPSTYGWAILIAGYMLAVAVTTLAGFIWGTILAAPWKAAYAEVKAQRDSILTVNAGLIARQPEAQKLTTLKGLPRVP